MASDNTEDLSASDDAYEFAVPYFPGEGESDKFPSKVINESVTMDSLDELGEELTKSDTLSNADKKKAADIISEAVMNVLLSGTYDKFIHAPENGFTQKLEVDGEPVAIQHPKVGGGDNGTLSGRQAINFINSQLGASTTVRIPCWNSGITLLLGNFRNHEFLSLIGRILTERHELGQSTRGALFSGYDVVINMSIIDFALDHVISSNVTYETASDLKDLILVSDIPTIIAGILSAYYPKGYPLIHTCIAAAKNKCDYGTDIKVDPETGRFKYHDLIDFRKVIWTDGKRISPEKRRLLLKPFGSVKRADVLAYQESMLPDRNIVIGSDNGIRYNLIGRHPNLRQYQTESNEWIADVISHVDNIINVADDFSEGERRRRRQEEISIFTSTLGRRRDIAWVEKIGVEVVSNDSENSMTVIDDMEAIKEIIDGELGIKFAKEIEDGIDEFKGKATVSVAGLTNFRCPKCGSGQSTSKRYPSLIPLNMVQYFFIIGEWMRQQTAVSR